MARRSTPPKARFARRREAKIAFDAITIEGALLQPELVTRVATSEPTQQLAADYGLDPGEKLREVVQTKFTQGQSLHARFSRSDKGPAALKRFLSSLFAEVFEFKDLAEISATSLNDRVFPIGHQALAGKVPIVFAPFEAIDKGDKAFGDSGRQRAPAQLLQEYLNATAGTALWGLSADGRTLRLYRANPAMTRPAYIEVDLAVLFDTDAPRLPDFSALWLLIHASRFGKAGTPPTDCPLEHWREEGREKGARAREDLRQGVEHALKSLGQGFLAHPANVKLKDDLAKDTVSPQEYLDALLRLVYRLIFVFAAEDRDLLHLPQPQQTPAYEAWRAARDVYRRGYGLARLRELSSKRHAHDRNVDGWEGTKILFRELWHGQPKLALPALGGLFAPGHVRDFADCQLLNQHFYAAIFNLAWLRTGSGLERVNWRDMETEELGSVYESLLELTPDLSGPLGFDFIQAAGHERKTTASYYTPDSLVQVLLDETLDPLIAERTKGKEGKTAIDALLDLRIIDPACGSAHFLLAAARRLAVRCAHLDKPGAAPSPADFRHWLREVARRALYGVDKNPMAIELAKVALWIETVEPGKPLSFLNSHLRCGDSLLGIYDLAALQIGIPDEAYKPLTGDVKKAATEWRQRNKAEREARKQGELSFFEPPREVLDAARALEAVPEDELATVEAKSERFRAFLAGPDRQRMEAACDLYVAAFLLPKTEGPVRTVGGAGSFVPTSRDVWDKVAGALPLGLIEASAIDVAKAANAFHWPLEFPHVFFPGIERQPGFDLALGNPPWEVNQLGEEEYFATKAPAIAKLKGKARKDAIKALEVNNPRLWTTYQVDKRILDATNEFLRNSMRFKRTALGKLNTYSLFAELFETVADRAGIVCPTAIATDDTNKTFFGHIVEQRRLASLLSFYETRRWFTDTDERKPFCLLSLSRRGRTEADFVFDIFKIEDLQDSRKRFSLTPADILLVNPNNRLAPIFRSRADAVLTASIYRRCPIVLRQTGEAEEDDFGLFLIQNFFSTSNADDQALFRAPSELSSQVSYLPILRGSSIHQYDHRFAGYCTDRNQFEDASPADKGADVDILRSDKYVPASEVEKRLSERGWRRRWLVGWRDITNSVAERTVVASAFPISGADDTLSLILPSSLKRGAAAILLAQLNSLALDYVAHQKVGGTHIRKHVIAQFPMLPPSAFSGVDLNFIIRRIVELTYTSHSMKPFADDLGFTGDNPFSWDEDRRALLRAELDAKIAALYGLERDQLRFILDPADIYGQAFPSETFRVLKKNEIAEYGEYRTARLVLDAWDRMERGELTT